MHVLCKISGKLQHTDVIMMPDTRACIAYIIEAPHITCHAPDKLSL